MQECRKELEDKNLQISKLKYSNESFSKYFICILKSLKNFSKSLCIIEPEDENKNFNLALLSFDAYLDFSKESNKAFNLFDSILKGFDSNQEQENFNFELNFLLESIENKLTKLITNLLNTKISKNFNQITKLIDEGISDEMAEFFNKEIISENQSLRKETDNIRIMLEENNKKYFYSEFEYLKISLDTKNKEVNQLKGKLEEIRMQIRQTRQKLSSSPHLPYILIEGSSYLDKTKVHNCLCYYCGFEICQRENENLHNENINNLSYIGNINSIITNTDNNEITRLPIFNTEIQQDVIMNDSSNNNSNNNSNKIHNLSVSNEDRENENITTKINYPSIRKLNENLNNNAYPSNIIANDENTQNYKHQNMNEINLITLSNINNNNLNSPQNSSDNDNDSIEKLNLNNLYKRLYEAYFNLKCEKTYSYQSILKSKPFQILLSQIENTVNIIEAQKLEILNSKKQLNDVYVEIKSQEKFLKLDKMKDVSNLEQKIETLQKDLILSENERSKFYAENIKNEEIIKTLKNFDYSQLNAIEEYFSKKNSNLLDSLKAQAKTYLEKFQAEFEKVEALERQNLKLAIELDRFKTALSKYESVEGIESILLFLLNQAKRLFF